MPDVTAVFNAVDNISNVARGVGDNLSMMAGVIGQTLSGAGGAVGDLGNAMQILATGPLGIVEAGIATTINAMEEMNSAMAGVSARTGLTGDALKQMRGEATALMNTGLASNFDEAARTIERVKTDINGINDSKTLQQFSTDTLAVAKAWGTTPKTVLDGVDSIQSKFKGVFEDPQRALDLLVKTAQNAHMPLSEVVKIVDSYGSKFAAAGLSALGMGALIAAGSNAGISNFSALATSIDAFHQRLIKPPPGFDAAVKKLGLGDAVADFRANKISMDTLLDDVFKKLESIKDPAARSQAAIDLFGKSIDKVGGGDKLAALAGYETTFGKIAGAADDVAKAMMDDGTLGTAITRFGTNLKTGLGNAAQDGYDRIKGMTDSISALWDALSNNTNGAMDKVKMAISAAFNDAKRDVEQKVQEAANTVSNTWNNAKSGVENAVKNVTDAVGNAWGEAKAAIKDAVSDAVLSVVTAWDNGKAAIQAAATGAVLSVSTAWNDVKTSVENAVNGALNAVVNGWVNGKAVIDAAIAVAAGGVMTKWDDAKRSVGETVSGIITGIQTAFNNAKDSVDSAVRSATDTVTSHWNNAKAAVEKTLGQFKQIISDAWNTAKSAVTTAMDGIRDGVQSAWNKVVEIVTAAKAAVQAAFEAIAQAIMAALAPVIAFINDIASKINSIGGAVAGLKGALGMHAQGGELDEGWNIVGEEGPEAIYKSGGRASVLTAGETKKMMVAGAGGGGGGGTTVHMHISGNTVVGSSGMEQFARVMFKKFQEEDQRRGKRD
jgi:TP901 family phage tail tape measure protein